MSQALDLALSICSGSTYTPGIVHDPALPLVVGAPGIGEIGVFSWNAVLHRVEIKALSQSQQDTISTLSFDSFGNMLINDIPLASQSDLAAAVEAANAAAVTAQQSAAAAQQALIQINDSSTEIATMIGTFQTDYQTAYAAIQQQVAIATQAASNTQAIAGQVVTDRSLSQAAAGSAQNAAAEATARASANSGVTFADGSKSAAAYADLARQYSQLSRLALTRPLVAASFPETFQPGSLFKRARVNGDTVDRRESR